MEIWIYTHDRSLAFDLLGKSQACTGDIIELDQEASLTYKGTYMRKASGFPEVVMLIASIPTSIAAGIIANWLWEKLKGRSVTQIEIDRTIVEFEEGEIKRVIHEKATKKGK
jgi:hypothetical protein